MPSFNTVSDGTRHFIHGQIEQGAFDIAYPFTNSAKLAEMFVKFLKTFLVHLDPIRVLELCQKEIQIIMDILFDQFASWKNETLLRALQQSKFMVFID